MGITAFKVKKKFESTFLTPKIIVKQNEKKI